MKETKTCKYCKFAKWKLSPKGIPSKKYHGECLYEIPEPTLPVSIGRHFNYGYKHCKVGIWLDMKEECPCFIKKEKAP